MTKASKEFVVGKHNIGYVSDSFKEKFYNAEVEEIEIVPSFITLKTMMDDHEIIEKYKPKSTIGDVLALLENPPKESKDGYFNIFHVAGFAVSVRWDAGGREWGVDGWELDDGGWGGGGRVFSATIPSEPLSPALGVSDTLPSELIINGVTYRRV